MLNQNESSGLRQAKMIGVAAFLAAHLWSGAPYAQSADGDVEALLEELHSADFLAQPGIVPKD